MKILVTGGRGFIGRYIVERLLQRGDDVVSFSLNSRPGPQLEGARTAQGDVRDYDAVARACRGCDAVIHVAGKSGGLWGKYRDYYDVNVVGTKHVIEACYQNAVSRLVFTSSPSVVFDNRDHQNVNEQYPYPRRYESAYPQTKAIAERMVLAASGRRGLHTSCLRPHIVWGPRDRQLLPRLIERARAGTLVQVGSGRNMVDISYVEDVARAHILVLDALGSGPPVAGSVYFISQNDPVCLWSWVRDLLARLELPTVQRVVSLRLARAAGLLFESAYRMLPLPGEPRLTRFLASELALSHYYDISRARSDFGFVPRFSMQAAMEKTLPYLKKLV